MNKATARDAAVFALLVAVAVAGRWGQPDWGVTPMAAVALFAGRCFGARGWAVATPIAALLLSDLFLPGYSNLPVMMAVYGAMVAPALLGRLLRRGEGPAWLARLAACSLAPATLFFLVTNLAVWAFQSDYPKNAGGLAACYAAALPFYGRMLLGDVFFTAVVFAAGEAAIATDASATRSARVNR